MIFSHANSFAASTYRVLFKNVRARGFKVQAIEKFGHDSQYPVTNNWPHLVQQLIGFTQAQVDKSAEPAFLVDAHILGGWRATTLGVIKSTQLVGSFSPGVVSRHRRNSWR